MKKKVLQVLNQAIQGGAEQHVLELVRGLANDFDFYVVCGDGPLAGKYRQAGATVIIDTPKLECDFLYSRRVFRLCRKEKIDVIHIHQLKSGSLATFGAFFARVPKRIYHEHTPITKWRLPRYKKATTYFLNWVVNWFIGNFMATDVMALTEVGKQVRVAEEKIWEKKITIIPNGVGVEKFQVSPERQQTARRQLRQRLGVADDTLVIGTLSRLTEEKGLEYLVRAVGHRVGPFKRVRPYVGSLLQPRGNIGSDPQKGSDPMFVVGGEGRLRKELEELAEELGVADRVTFLGFVAEDEKVDYYVGLDIFALPSLAEGFGIGLIEAMAAGLPCLASDLPVLEEVGGDAIVTFKSKDPQDLAEKLQELVGDKERRGELGRQAQRRVGENYSMERFLSEYKSLYEE